MQRELKFRAWDTELKEMLNDWDVRENGIWLSTINKLEETLADRNRFVLMQFTGLLDKNGKEIYERDIVEHYGEVFFVGFEQGAFVVKGVTIRENPDGSEYKISDDLLMNQNTVLVVIGNVYENPELLKEA